VAGLVLTVAAAVAAAKAQEAPAQSGDAVRSLLERVEFDGHETPETLAEELRRLTRADMAELCARLTVPEAGDDTRVRMVLHALVWQVVSPGQERQRADFVVELCAALERGQPAEVRGFVVEQLMLVGAGEAGPTLGRLLRVADSYAAAARALEALGGAAAAQALRAALTDVRGGQRVAVINAVGGLRDEAAVPLLLAALDEEDVDVQWAAWQALANVGAVELDAQLPDNTQTWGERARLSALRLRLGASGGAPANGRRHVLLERVLDAGARAEVHERCGALVLLSEILGTGAVERVVAAVMDEHPELRATALEIAAGLPGDEATAAFVGLWGVAGSEARAGILLALARRGDAAAWPLARQALGEEDTRVRLAAVTAAAALGRTAAVGPLVAFMADADAEERKAAQAALVELSGEQVSAEIAALLGAVVPEVRAALLEVVGRRRAVEQLGRVYEFAADADAGVRTAALRAAGVLGGAADVARVLGLSRVVESEPERAVWEDALAAVCGRAASAKDVATLLLTALDGAAIDDAGSLLRVLGRLGGSSALDALRRATADEREAVREAAVRALGAWPDGTAAETVLEIAADASELKLHVLALRAYARLVGLEARRSATQTLALYERGMDVARRVEERRMLLSGVGQMRDAGALTLLARYMNAEELGGEAAAAVLGVAEGLLPWDWAAARGAVEVVRESKQAEALAARADAVLARVAEVEGYVTDWLVAGPYEQAGKRGNELLGVVFAPELSEAPAVEWRRQPRTEDAERHWHIDLAANKTVAGNDRAAYLLTHLHLAAAQRARLELGSDDGLKVWLNGECVHENNALRGCTPKQDVVVADLRAGWNVILLKVTNAGGGWGAALRVRSEDGGSVAGLRVRAEPIPAWGAALSPDELRNIEAALPERAPAVPQAGRRLLVFTLCKGFRHSAIECGAAAVAALGERTGAYEAVVSDDLAVFTADRLQQFDAVCFMNTTGELLVDEAARRSLLDFVRGGRGVVGIHGATDCCYEWPEFGELMGGYFDGHPWGAGDTVTLKVEEPEHPLCRAFGSSRFTITDEIYQFRAPYSRAALRVLLSLDTQRTDMNKPGIKRTDGDFAVSWVRSYGEGRMFYCSLGHREDVFWNRTVLEHYLAGIQFALGDLPADATPSER
jgi:type 1 glutamine amidotransferase/HEAT repeat protein/fructose-specific component phosphotransferase system IIB-like protein